MKAIFCHQKQDGLPKHCPKKINKALCTIFYTEKMTTIPNITTVDTRNFQLLELIQMEFDFYNVTSIR